MKRHPVVNIYMLIVIAFILSAGPVTAEDLKERMKVRLPVIAELKTRGIIGENNRGYLGFVTAEKIKKDIISAENKDRKTVYTNFAKQQKTTLEIVEKIQAQRKSQKAKSGEFLQKTDGSWVKKGQ